MIGFWKMIFCTTGAFLITLTKAYISHVDSPWSGREKTFLKWLQSESAMFAYPK